VALELELRALFLSHSSSPFFLVMDVFEIRSQELFAQGWL
jgi:hypothetical protein